MDHNIGKKLFNLVIQKKLGTGSYGLVYLAHGSKGKPYAIKIIPRSSIVGPIRINMLLNEVNICTLMNHPNIIKLIDQFKTASNFYLVYEYCDLGNLLNYYITHPLIFTEEVAICFITDICKGYYALYEKNIIHRDIKLGNIFLKSGLNGKIEVKIGDFGFSKIFEKKSSEARAESIYGSICYMSPEMLTNSEYNYKSDIFSIGISLYFMLFGKYPFDTDNYKLLYDYYKAGKVQFDIKQRKLSKYTIDFVLRCLQFKASMRMRMKDVMRHKLVLCPYSELSTHNFENIVYEGIINAE